MVIHDYKKSREHHRWVKSELNFIKENYSTMSDEQMSIVMNRTANSIATKRSHLGILRKRKRGERRQIIQYGLVEARRMQKIFSAVNEMKDIISEIEIEENLYKKEKLKARLKLLSDLKI